MEEDDVATVVSDSEDEGETTKHAKGGSGDLSTTFKPYAGGGAKRLSIEGFGSLPTDIKSKTAFTGLRDPGEIGDRHRAKRMEGSDDDNDDSEEERPRKKAGQVLEKEAPKPEPSTLAFTNDAISLEQVSYSLTRRFIR